MDDDNHIGDIESVAELDRVIALAKFAVNAKNIELRARALAKLNRHIREGETKLVAVTAAMEQKHAALTEREAAIAAREIALEKRETEFAASAQDVRDELYAHHNRVEQAHSQLVRRVMATAGILGEWNFQLQDPPSWDVLKRLVALPDDLPAPAAEVVSENVREDWVGHTFVPGSTLTRSIIPKPTSQ